MDIHLVADAGQAVLADVKENRDDGCAIHCLRKPKRLDIESEALEDRDARRIDDASVAGQTFLEAIFLNGEQELKIMRTSARCFAHCKARQLQYIASPQYRTIDQIWELLGKHVGQHGRI